MLAALKIVCLIPARLQSSRLPEKLIQTLGDKTVIQHSYLNAVQSGLFNDVVVVGDDQKIRNSIEAIGGSYISSEGNYECGSDRIAAVAKQIDADIIVNLQGDEPFTSTHTLQILLSAFKNEQVQVASLMHPISAEEAKNPNFVKVVCDHQQRALLFSRSVIPYNRDHEVDVQYYKHIGIYAFRKNALLQFATLAPSKLERIEKLENLRFIENNIPIQMLLTDEKPIGIDTAEDLARARTMMA